jgi:glycosyltransferase involved in cell wall biosynthesis
VGHEFRPLVSVIIASYNHAHYVEQALQSVLRQHVKDIEVIVVDDGSNDETPNIVEHIRDSRLKLFRQKENRREHPRNIGLAKARGRYIAFQNSDDVWRDAKLETQLAVLEQRNEVVASFTGVETIGRNGQLLVDSWANGLFLTQNRTQSAWLRHFFDKGNCLCLPSAVVRREPLMSSGGFRSSLIQLGDFDLWVRLAAQGEFFISEEALTQMRILENNLSGPSDVSRRRSAIEFVEVLMRYTEPPVLSLMGDCFQDLLPCQPISDAVRLAGLARYAWTLGPTHRMFADRVMATILDDPQKRRETVEIYGTQILHEFFKKRSELEVNLPPSNARVTAKNQFRGRTLLRAVKQKIRSIGAKN